MKSLRTSAVFIVTCIVISVALGLLSGYLQAHGEHAIPLVQRLTMSLGAAVVLSAISTTLSSNRSQLRAPAAQDSNAKRFAPVAERTVVYLFRDAFVGKMLGLDIAIDGLALGQTRGKTFYRLELAPGEHVLSSINPQDNSRQEYRFTAAAGALMFLEQAVRLGGRALRHEIAPAAAAEAADRVRRCRMLLPAAG